MSTRRISPPSAAEALLRRVTPAAMQAGLLGDLEERYQSLSASRGLRAARLWYWAETLHALPGLWLYSIESIQLRRQTVNGNILVREGKWSVALGAFFLFPLALLVIPGVLLSFFGKMVPASLNSIPGVPQILAIVDNPWLVLGGLALGLVINLIAVLRIKLETLEGALAGYRPTQKERLEFGRPDFSGRYGDGAAGLCDWRESASSSINLFVPQKKTRLAGSFVFSLTNSLRSIYLAGLTIRRPC